MAPPSLSSTQEMFVLFEINKRRSCFRIARYSPRPCTTVTESFEILNQIPAHHVHHGFATNIPSPAPLLVVKSPIGLLNRLPGSPLKRVCQSHRRERQGRYLRFGGRSYINSGICGSKVSCTVALLAACEEGPVPFQLRL